MIATALALFASMAPMPVGPAPQAHSASVASPMHIPFNQKRKDEMSAYSGRHYGKRAYKLTAPKVIVEHMAETSTMSELYNTFAPDRADSELRELPGVCSHFGVGKDGKAYEFVPTTIRCRHTVGLNYTAIGIEHVGFGDGDLLGNRKELAISLKLTNELRCKYGIELKNVIGHNESLSSPFHMELVDRLKSQTHGDMKHASMVVYRKKLAKLSC